MNVKGIIDELFKCYFGSGYTGATRWFAIGSLLEKDCVGSGRHAFTSKALVVAFFPSPRHGQRTDLSLFQEQAHQLLFTHWRR